MAIQFLPSSTPSSHHKTGLRFFSWLSAFTLFSLQTATLNPATFANDATPGCIRLYSQISDANPARISRDTPSLSVAPAPYPADLSQDQSLIALRELYGKKIEIQDETAGPWIYLRAEDQTRDFAQIDTLRIGTYNMLNLIQTRGKHVIDSSANKLIRVTEPIDKPQSMLVEQGKIITGQKLDILSAQEVESLEAAKILNRDHLSQMYRPLLIHGNDERDINILFYFKKDLPFDFEIQSHRKLEGDYLGRVQPVFSRDLVSIMLRPKGAAKTEKPFLILLGQHLKSKRDGAQDPESRIRRLLQIDKTVEVLRKFEAQYPDVPILTLGDFNGDLRSGPEFSELWTQGKLKDSFDLASRTITPEQRITHTFHPKGAETVRSQLDGVLVSTAGQKPGLIKEARIVRYLDENGKEKPIPETYADRKRNPSDHFPIVTEWDFKKLISQASQESRSSTVTLTPER